jgi:hypothetical protein
VQISVATSAGLDAARDAYVRVISLAQDEAVRQFLLAQQILVEMSRPGSS